jgi:polar amino acid transport system substrate-binding protein
MTISDALIAEIAPDGKLRAGINYSNPVLARKDAATGEISGVAVDLANELGLRLGIAVEILGYEAAGKLFAAAKADAWDVAFLAVDPGRAAEVDFTAPYVEIDGTYLFPPSSKLAGMADVDQEGIRVGISQGSAYDLFLSRNIRRAQLIRAPNPDAAFQLLVTGSVDVLAGVRQHLVTNAAKLPGARVLTDRFMAIGQAMGVPKGRDQTAGYVRAFVEEMKSSGFVARALERAGITGVTVPRSSR